MRRGQMNELLKGITITEQERRVNTKASESYVPVLFEYTSSTWDGWVPVEYRRTGVNIPEDDNDHLITYLNLNYSRRQHLYYNCLQSVV